MRPAPSYDRPMARLRPSFFCQECGHESLTWSGRCTGCGEWNTLVEAPKRRPAAPEKPAGAARAAPGSPGGRCRCAMYRPRQVARLRTGIAELDRVLGGGLVPGSLVLLGGSPGIGKSTLTGMALGNLGARPGTRCSTSPARSRRPRCGCAPSGSARRRSSSRRWPRPRSRPSLRPSRPSGRQSCVIDSIQTLHAEGMTGAPGSVGQVREAAGRGHGGRQAARLRGDPRRPRDQGRRRGRAAGARAPGRLRALLRGRARAQLPHPAGAQEPLRRHQRGRRLRDALRRPGRGRRPVGPLRRARPAPRPGSVVLCSMEGTPAAAGRGPGARRARPRSSRRAGSPTGSTATASR